MWKKISMTPKTKKRAIATEIHTYVYHSYLCVSKNTYKEYSLQHSSSPKLETNQLSIKLTKQTELCGTANAQ